MLEESKIDGGEILETLGQRLRDEGREAEKLKIARELIKNGVDRDVIAGATGLPLEKIQELASKAH